MRRGRRRKRNMGSFWGELGDEVNLKCGARVWRL